MRGVQGGQFSPKQRRAAITALTLFAICWLYFPLAAQYQGPIAPPPGMTPPPSAPPTKPASVATPKAAAISTEPPPIPIDQIIQKFAAREAEFKAERDNFTYTQTFVVQTLDDANRVDGEYRMTSDIVFGVDGKRFEKVTSAPPPTLERLMLTQEDFNDLEHVFPFVLTTDELPRYDVKYVGREPLDELSTYIFEIAPKAIGKNQRFFQGRVWVDDKDFQIVKTFGKAVGYSKKSKNGNDQVFPNFETFRENIEGSYWFPTYTRSDEVFHFKEGDIHTRMTVRYENYKRFGVTVKIGKPTETDKNKQ
jgi:hypothetical protein